MSRWVCLLKGVNVGGKNSVHMGRLRELFESLGHRDVATYIQSGNVVFTPKGRVLPSKFEAAISERFGVQVAVMVRSGDEFTEVLRENPFLEYESKSLHVGFFQRPPDPATIANLQPEAFAPERFALRGRECYLYLPNGMARTKLPASLERALKLPATIRNWRTLGALGELAAS